MFGEGQKPGREAVRGNAERATNHGVGELVLGNREGRMTGTLPVEPVGWRQTRFR